MHSLRQEAPVSTEANAPEPAPGETKDWTVVLDGGCQECGWHPFDAHESAQRLIAAVPRWAAALGREDATERPEPRVWSPVEYACHARDLVGLLGERVTAMLTQDDPEFADSDGDAQAVTQRTWAAEPPVVAAEMLTVTDATVAVLNGIRDDQWQRTGHRSDGVQFTVDSLCQYIVHDVEHHLWDVSG